MKHVSTGTKLPALISVWQCYYCGNVYGEKKNCMNHVRRNHHPTVSPHMFGTPVGFQCPDCKLCFKTEEDLKLHICGTVPTFWTNESEKPKCPQCAKTFKNYDEVLYHFAVTHVTEEKFQCDKCDFKAKHPKDLSSHKCELRKKSKCDMSQKSLKNNMRKIKIIKKCDIKKEIETDLKKSDKKLILLRKTTKRKCSTYDNVYKV